LAGSNKQRAAKQLEFLAFAVVAAGWFPRRKNNPVFCFVAAVTGSWYAMELSIHFSTLPPRRRREESALDELFPF